MRHVTSALLLLLLSRGAAATPDDNTAAVLPLQRGASVGESEASAIRAAIRGSIPRSLPVDEVDRRLMVTDVGCVTTQCLRKASTTLAVQRLVGGRLDHADPIWTLDLWLFDAATGATVATLRDQCGGCNPEQAATWAGQVATRLASQASPDAAARLLVRSTPPGAEVTIDGTPVGVSGMTFGVTAGHHTVTVALAGHRLAVHEVTARAGALTTVESRLERAEAPVDTEPRGTFFTARVFRWVTLGGAVAALAAGITLIAVDGRGTCEEGGVPGAQCEEQLNTLAAGAALTAVGGLLAATAAYLFYRDARSRGSVQALIAPLALPGGGGIGATWRY